MLSQLRLPVSKKSCYTTQEHFTPAILVAAKAGPVWIGFSKLAEPKVAALAYGTETIPKVDKITGPGNIFVATAKKMVYGVVGIIYDCWSF